MTKLTIETPARLEALSNRAISPDITEVKVGFNITPGMFHWLGRIISRLHLDSLDLSHTNLRLGEANALANMLRKTPVSIDKLYLQNNAICNTGMMLILKEFIHMRTSVVDLSNNNIDLRRPLGEAFRADLQRILKFSKIQKLILDHNNIGSVGTGDLARASIESKLLTDLSLESAEIMDAGARSLANMAKYSPIKSINLSNNRITHEGSKAIAEALLRGYFEEVDFSGNTISPEAARIFGEVAVHRPDIKVIDLPSSHLGDAGVEALMDPLSASTIGIIILDNNDIGDIGLAAISRAISRGSLCRSIKTISVQTNNIGDAGAIALAEAMECTKSLNTLNLMENGIGNIGAIALGNALKLSAVNKLNVAYNFIGDEGIEAIASSLPLSAITDLRVAGNLLTDAGIDALSRYVPSSLVNTVDEVLMIPKYWEIKETFVAPDGTPLFRIFKVPNTLYSASKDLYPLMLASIEIDRATHKPTVFFGTLNDLATGVKFLILDFLAGEARISGNYYRNADIMAILGSAYLTDGYVDSITGKVPYNIAQKKIALLYEGKQQKRAERDQHRKEEAEHKEKVRAEKAAQQRKEREHAEEEQQCKEKEHAEEQQRKGPTVEEIIEEEHKVFSKRSASSHSPSSQAGSPIQPQPIPSAPQFPEKASSSSGPSSTGDDPEVTSKGSKGSYIAAWQSHVEGQLSPVASPRAELESSSSASTCDRASIPPTSPLMAEDGQQQPEQVLPPVILLPAPPSLTDNGAQPPQLPTVIFHRASSSAENLDHIIPPPTLPPTVIIHRRLMTLLPDEPTIEVQQQPPLPEPILAPAPIVVVHNEHIPSPPTVDLSLLTNAGGTLMRFAENKETIKYFLSYVVPIGHVGFLDNTYLMMSLHVLGGFMLVSSIPSAAALSTTTKLALPIASSAIYGSKQWLYESQKEESINNQDKNIGGIKDFFDVCGKQMLVGAEISLLTHLPYSLIFGPNVLGMGLSVLQGAVASGAMCYALHSGNSNNHGYLSQHILPSLASAGTAYALYKGGMLPAAADFTSPQFLTGIEKMFSSLSTITLSHYMTKIAANDLPIIDHIENEVKELLGLQQHDSGTSE